jgi:hypothetical protein
MVHASLAMPHATAGVVLSVMCIRQKVYQPTKSANINSRFSHFLLKAFVRRVNRRFCMRTVRLLRSMCEVQIWPGHPAARARLDSIDGRFIKFSVEAHDGVAQIGTGTHVRALVDLSRFNKKLDAT